jgi:hypothetical protein
MPFLAAIPAAIGIGSAGAAAGGAAVGVGAAAAGTAGAVAGGATIGSLAGITAAGAGASVAGGATIGSLAGLTAAGAGTVVAGGATVGSLAGGATGILASGTAAGAGTSLLGQIGQGMSLMGTMSDMTGSIGQGNSISAAGNANAHMAELNAIEARKEGTRARLKAGAVQTTAYAKAGVVTSTGTPLQVMHDTTEAIELNTMNEVRKWHFQAEQLKDAATDAKHAGLLGGLTKGLGGFGSFLGKMGRLDVTPAGKALWG